jgi:hypothetical protein
MCGTRTHDQHAGTHPKSRQRGIAAVELAILLPVIVFLLAVPLYFGRIYWHYSAAQSAANNAARYLSSIPLVEMKNPLKVSASVAIANDMIQAHTEDLNSGPYPPIITVLCDGHVCDGFSTPTSVKVIVRMYLVDLFFSGITEFLWGEEGIPLTADANYPYVGT